MRPIDLTGQRIGRWTVLSRSENTHTGGTAWLCRCDCGGERVISGVALRGKRSQSCGCLKSEAVIKRSTKHGHANAGKISATYHSWAGMKARCSNPLNSHYSDYGGRGVRVCERWQGFAAFLEDMGTKPRGTSIDRIDNSRGYEPGNCRWASPREQARNKRNNRVIEWNGRSQTLMGWAEEIGISPSTLSERLERWPVERALTTPKLDDWPRLSVGNH